MPAEPGADRRIVAFVTAAGETADESWLEVDLPSGHRVAGLNLNETEYVYQEIFVDEVYSRDGIVLPPDAVVMVNDPPALYYHAGLAGVVVPNADPAVVPEIARRYGVTHLLLDVNRTAPFTRLWLGREQRDFLRLLRVYGAETPDPADDRRLFAIVLQEQSDP